MDPVLYIAVESGNIDVLMHNKDKIGVEVTPNQNTVLHIASQLGKTECVQKILSVHPLLLRRVNSSGKSAFHLAAKNGHYDVVLELASCATLLDASELESGVGAVKEMLRLTNEDEETALHEDVRYNRFDIVDFLTKEDPEYLYATNNDGETPLYVPEGGFHEFVEVILKTCKSPSYSGPGDRTTLHGVVIFKNEGIKELVDWNKSLVQKTDENGQKKSNYTLLIVGKL
ncbi:unnamed protein product [Ilex paraguariensis]|uniref:Uncharacterized protein n=1 Tax=Ilex paraguariensis TaxID=185542 RepID=A0ABC8QVC0_9AQUA